MNRILYLIGGAALGIAIYKIFSESDVAYPDGVARAAGKSSAWGTGQRVRGTGSQAVGGLQRGAGDLLGDPELSSQGALNEAKGSLKNAAGQVAQAIGNTLSELDK